MRYLALIALLLSFAAGLSAQSTNGTLASTDPSFTHPGSPMLGGAGGPKYYEALEFNVVTTGNYTFSYTTTGYQGAMYLYQGAFLPGAPIANIWSWGAVSGNPVSEVHNLSVTGKFVLVLTSTATSATGTWSVNITGPGTLQMGPNVKSVSPTSGSTGGGTALTISGDFFTGVNSVTIGGASATALTVVNSTTITCTSPAGAAGAANVTATNPAGFSLTNTLTAGYTYVSTPTSVSSINRQSPAGTTTNATSVTFRVTFAASVAGVNTGNFQVTASGPTGTSVSSVTGSGTTRDVVVNTGSGDGTIRLDMVNATGMTPGLTNVPFTSGQSYTIDKTAPTVSSINRAGADPTNATSVTFTVTFSESVTGVTLGAFSLDTTGVSGPSITGISGSGTTYTVTVNTGTGDGTVSIDLLTVTGIADTAGNALGSAFVAGQAYTIDKTPPGVSISAPSTSATTAGPVDYTVTYTGASSVTLATGNITLNTTGTANGTVTVTGSGTGSRTVTISSITGSGTIGISIAAGTATDAAANSAPAAGPSATFTVTAVATVSSIVRTGATPTNAASVSWTVTFSGAVTGVATGNFGLAVAGLAGASVTGVSGSGTTWTVTASTGTGNGTIRLDMNNTTGVSPSLSNVPFTTGQSYSIDKTAPSVTSIARAGSNPTNAASVGFTVTFSESVTGVTTAAFAMDASGVTAPSVTGVSGSGTTWTVTVSTGTGSGSVSIDLATIAGIADGAGNGLSGAFTAGEAYTVDKAAPSVTSIVRAGTNPTNAASVTFTVTFSETVSGVTLGAFAMNTTGVAGASVTGVSGSGATRTVTASTGTGSGTVTVELASITGIVDAAGNTLSGTFTAGEIYTVDKTAPTVSSIVRANADPTSAATVNFTVTISESVTGVTAGAFALDVTGVTGASITGVTGSGTTWNVSVNTGSGDGTVSIDLATVAGITDAAGNVLAAAFTAGEVYTIDKTNPGIAIGAPTPGSTGAGPIDFVVTYTGASSVTLSAGDVTLNTTGTATGTVSVTGSGTATRTVTVSAVSGNGTIGISIAANTATDGASNPAPAAGPSATATVANVPGISIGAPSVSTTMSGPVDFVITYTNATAVTLATGDVTVSTTGTAAGTAAVTGSGTATRTVTISGITGTGTFTISIAAGTASNPGGSAVAAGPSAAVDVDNTAPGITAGTALSIPQGGASSAAALATVTDNLTAAASVAVTATTLPTGITVSGIANAAGAITGNVQVAFATTVGSYQVELTATDSVGNTATANLTVNVTANNTPTITTIADQTIAMNANTGALTFDVDDADEGPAALVVTFDSNNPVLIDVLTDIVIGGTGANRTVTVTPQADSTGVAVVTITVADSNGVSASTSFTLTVTDTTDAPALAGLVNQTIVRDTTAGPFVFTATDPQGDGTLGAPSAVSSNPALIPDANVVFTGTAPNLSFTITPTAAMTGTADITISISDGTHTTSQTITVTVIDPPTGGGGGKKKDDDGCAAGSGNNSWMMLAALLSTLVVATRLCRKA